jgi:peptidoglycan/xylan/chitin deacetylase (PgdA/CDA1 family)
VARIALKVDVDTLRGTVEGVPRLLAVLRRHRARATFLFSLGPDHTGWALKRVFRPGFLTKVSRTSVVRHYGLKTLSYGVLLPAPDIGRRAAAPMRECARDGHECGLHAWDHVVWHDHVRHRDERWTRAQMARGYARFQEIFGAAPSTHGAAGWQSNGFALRQIDEWGMAYASDGRGDGPYRPVVGGTRLEHLQMPTTLPTFDELIGLDGVMEASVDQALLRLTEGDADHVFTLHAELEGGALAPVFDRLLAGWRAQGHTLCALQDLHGAIAGRRFPDSPLEWGTVPGRSGELMISGSPTAPSPAC